MADHGTGLRVVLALMVFLATCIFQTQGIIDLKGTNMRPPIASQGQFPWQVLVETTKPTAIGTCGASIIAEQWILGAAHCFVQKKYGKDTKPDGFTIIAMKIELYAGILNKKIKDGAQKREYDANQIRATGNDRVLFIHEDYNKETEDDNDIALLKMKKPMVYGTNVKPIYLATPADVQPKIKLTASGWGNMVRIGEKDIPDDLRFINDLILRSSSQCEGPTSLITAKQICQLSMVKGTNDGDSGGPVITLKEENNQLTYVQVGIISRDVIQPVKDSWIISIFTDVSKFRDWIRAIMDNSAPSDSIAGQVSGQDIITSPNQRKRTRSGSRTPQ